MSKAEDLVNKTMEVASKLEEGDLNDFLIEINLISLAALRGIHGDTFAKDFLTAALDDKNPIKITPHD